MPTRIKSFITSIRPSSWAWFAFPVLAAIGMCVLIGCGLCSAGPQDLAFFFILTAVTAVTSLARDRISPPDEPSSRSNALLIGCVTVLAWFALEMPWNDRYLLIPVSFTFLEAGIVLAVIVAFYLLCQRRGIGAALGVAIFQGIGLAQYFVSCFKKAAILPGDIFSLGTAAAVAGGYRYEINGPVVCALACSVAAVGLCAQMRPPLKAATPKQTGMRVASNLAGSAAVVVSLVLLFTCVDFANLSVTIDYWWTLNKYREQGIIPTFVLFAQKLPIEVPEGYSEQAAEELEQKYDKAWEQNVTPARKEAEKQFDELKPVVVAIMNETFSDLTLYDNLIKGYDGPTFFKSVPEGTLATGPLAVSVFGGGTCNSEFEFLTGNTLAYVGAGKYPYSLYNLSKVENMARLFKDMGYRTIAMHPEQPDNWQRNRIYPELGFDRFLSIGDFVGAKTYHGHVSDEATYDTILDLIKNSDEPLFVFDVTMQNHSGYDTGIIPAKDKLNFAPKGLSSDVTFQLNEYLACITESDRALKEFLGELQELDRPVALAFFGDHQPFISESIDHTANPTDSDIGHVVREYQTSYLIWTNYDVAGADKTETGEFTSPNYLGMDLMNRIGAPLSNFQRSQLAAREDVRAFTLMCFLDDQGVWHQIGSDEALDDPTVKDMYVMGYRNLGSKV